MELLLGNEKDLWDLIKNQKLSYDSFERLIFSDSYLKACEKFDFTYSKSIYNENWNIYELKFHKKHNTNSIFFQRLLDKEISESEYFECENNTISFLEKMYEPNCLAFYEINSDSLDNNYPAQQSRNVLHSWNFLKEHSGAFIKIKDISLFKEISYLGIREIGLVYFIFCKSKSIVIPNECKCTILTEQNLLHSFSNELDNITLIKAGICSK